MATLDSVLKKLKTLRTRTDLTLRPTRIMRRVIHDMEGRPTPLQIRYYQVQGILHLVTMPRFVLGDDTGIGKCVTGDTLLLTDRGLLPIYVLAPKPVEQLVPGTFYNPAFPVRVWSGRRWVLVQRFYYDGLRDTKRIQTRSGFTVEGSHQHPLKCRGPEGEGWCRLPDVQVGDYVLVDRQDVVWPEDPEIGFTQSPAPGAKEYKLPTRMTSDLARLLGYIVAEGHSPNRYRITVTQHDPDAHTDIRNLFKTVFGWEGNYNNARRDTSIEVTSVQIRAFLERCGIGAALSAGKCVPPLVLQASRGSVVGFLRGLFEGEGHAIKGGAGLEVSSASECLLREVQLLLLRLGMVSVRKPHRIKGRSHIYWRLTLFGEDARIFARQVGFVTRRKQQVLIGARRGGGNPNLDVVPHAREIVEALRAEIYARCGRHGYTGEGISKRWGTAFYNTLGHVRAGRRNPTYEFLSRMVQVGCEVGVPEQHPTMCAVREICDKHAFYDPVVDIGDGFTEVMDIEVDGPDHCFVGNGLVNHNTLQSIGALAYLWEKKPDQKVIVLTTKSAVKQWLGEFQKFTKGVVVVICTGTPEKRHKILAEFQKLKGPCVLLLGYRTAVQDFSYLQEWKNHILIADEATAFKNPKAQIHQVVKHLADSASRVWGLTATIIKNNLIEGFGVYKVIQPELFGTQAAFVRNFCVTRLQPIKGGRKIPVIVGYRKGQILAFKNLIDPYFLGRAKFEVASELPMLTTQKLTVSVTPAQAAAYAEALSGVLQVGSGSGTTEEKEITKLTAVTYCQEIVNHLGLIGREGASGKLDTLLDLLTVGDFVDEKVIVFTRFRKMVDIALPVLEAAGVRCVRITGAENEDKREDAKQAFLNPESDVKVIFITAAGSESINLQAAKALVFYDSPWSAGDYIQIVGRMIRIGSMHDRVYALHLIAENSVDQRVMEVLSRKLRLIESVIGKRIKGEGDDFYVESENDLSAIFSGLREDARQMLMV